MSSHRSLVILAVLALLASIPFFIPGSTAVHRANTGDAASTAPGPPGAVAKTERRDERAAKAKLREEKAALEQARQQLRSDPVVGKIWEKDSFENNLQGDLLGGFDPAWLRERLAQKEPNPQEIATLILRAAAERSPACKDLLQRPELRTQDPSLDMALSAYDYMVNGNDAALDHILETHRAAGAKSNWGSPATWALAYVDEWPRTEAALKSHLMMGDGTAGDERYAFWLGRRYLFPLNRDFPTDYERFWKDLARAQGWKASLD